MVDFRTIARHIAEEEAEDAYDALSEEIQDLREEVALLRQRIERMERPNRLGR